MAINAKKIVITTVSSELLIVRPLGRSVNDQFCTRCGVDVEMLTLDAAVTLSAITTRMIFSHTESGAVHSAEDANGHLLICRPSLEDLHGWR
jgi:hypothetical protein